MTVFTLGYHPRPRTGSRSRILLNKENDIIIFRKSELRLNLCNKLETNIYRQFTTPMSVKLLKYPRVRKSLKYFEIVNHRITLGIIITPNPQFQELLKYPQVQKLQNCPNSVKLPKCPYQSTVTEVWSTLIGKLKSESSNHAEFNGTSGELQRALTTPKSSSAAVNSNN